MSPRNIKEARAVLRSLVEREVLPCSPDGFTRVGSGNVVLRRIASRIHSERIRISVYRCGERYMVQMGIGVRYPAFEWIMGAGRFKGTEGLGYHVGLRHRPPGEDKHPLEAPDLADWLLHDIREHGLPYFEAMSTPERVLRLVRQVPPKEQLFHLGGPEGQVCSEAALEYAYFDKARARALLQDASLDTRFDRPQDIRAMLEFLRTEPTIPKLKPHQ